MSDALALVDDAERRTLDSPEQLAASPIGEVVERDGVELRVP